jgi:hypothetical protein
VCRAPAEQSGRQKTNTAITARSELHIAIARSALSRYDGVCRDRRFLGGRQPLIKLTVTVSRFPLMVTTTGSQQACFLTCVSPRQRFQSPVINALARPFHYHILGNETKAVKPLGVTCAVRVLSSASRCVLTQAKEAREGVKKRAWASRCGHRLSQGPTTDPEKSFTSSPGGSGRAVLTQTGNRLLGAWCLIGP